MRKNLTIVVLLFISISIAFVSCSDNVEPAPQKLTRSELFVGDWKLDSSIAPTIKDYKLPDGLIRLSITSSGSFTSYINSSVTKVGNWQLSGNDNLVTFHSSNTLNTVTYTISTLNEQNLILNYFKDTNKITDYFTKYK